VTTRSCVRQSYGSVTPSLLEIAQIERDARDTTTNTDANEA
jgi:hypothetical protein